jgi:hypothetical protein
MHEYWFARPLSEHQPTTLAVKSANPIFLLSLR